MTFSYTNPFLAYQNMDFSKFDPMTVLKNVNLPGVDVEAVFNAQRKNIEALAQANTLAVEGMHAVAKRQSEILAQTMTEVQNAAAQLRASQGPRDLTAKQAELLKQAFEKAIANMRDLAEMVSKSNTAAFETISKRVSSSLEELKSFAEKT